MGCQPSAASVRDDQGAPARCVESTGPTGTFCLTLQGKPGSLLGATLADCSGDVDGAVVVQVSQGGLLHEWNRRAPDRAVGAGDVILRLNGATGYWGILGQIKKMGSLDIVVRRAAGGDRLKQDACLEQDLAAQGSAGAGSLLLRVPRHSDGGCCGDGIETGVVALPIRRSVGSSQCGSEQEQCCICLDVFQTDENMVQLACGHEFHAECMYKWLQSSFHGKCPLCSRPAFDTGPEGGS